MARHPAGVSKWFDRPEQAGLLAASDKLRTTLRDLAFAHSMRCMKILALRRKVWVGLRVQSA